MPSPAYLMFSSFWFIISGMIIIIIMCLVLAPARQQLYGEHISLIDTPRDANYSVLVLSRVNNFATLLFCPFIFVIFHSHAPE